MRPERNIEMAREMSALLAEDLSEVLKRRMGIAFAGGIPFSVQSAAVAMLAEAVNRTALGLGLVGIDSAARPNAAAAFAAVLINGIERNAADPNELCAGFDQILSDFGVSR